MKRNNFKKQSGRSMVEMLGVLAIIGVLSVGAIAGYNMAIEKHRLNQAIEAINLIIQEIRITFASQRDYNGLGEAISKDFMGATAGGEAVAARILQKLKINTSYYPILVQVFPATTGRAEMGFQLGVLNIPQASCIKLFTMNWQDYGDDYAEVMKLDGSGQKQMMFSEAKQACKDMEEVFGFAGFGILFNPTH